MRIVAISDTHNQHRKLKIPDGDVLVHAGDITMVGEYTWLDDFDEWLGDLPHKRKLVVAGNHDLSLERSPNAARRRLTNCLYLQDSGVLIDDLLFYGAPWSLRYLDWAFMEDPDKIADKWDKIPGNTDVLITHGPPLGHGDRNLEGLSLGCPELLKKVEAVTPKLHIFGHIHEGYGATFNRDTVFANVSSCNREYRAINPPFVYDI